MRQQAKRWRPAALSAGVGLGLWIGAMAQVPAPVAAAPSRPSPSPQPMVATASLMPEAAAIHPAEGSQEAILRELDQAPFLPPEIFSELPYSVPAPIIGGLGVEVE